MSKEKTIYLLVEFSGEEAPFFEAYESEEDATSALKAIMDEDTIFADSEDEVDEEGRSYTKCLRFGRVDEFEHHVYIKPVELHDAL